LERKTDSDKSFFAYFDEIKELVEINKSVDKIIPSLQEYSDKKKKERLGSYLWGFASAALIAILTWLLTK